MEGNEHMQKKAYIWGTGYDAFRLINRYPILAAICECFIDSDKRKRGKIFFQKLILEPEVIDFTDENVWVIIATSKYCEEVIGYLKSRNFEHYNYFQDKDLFEVLFSNCSEGVFSRIKEYKELCFWFPYMSTKFIQNFVYGMRCDEIIGEEGMDSYSVISYCSDKDSYVLCFLLDTEYEGIKISQEELLAEKENCNSIDAIKSGCYCRKEIIKALKKPNGGQAIIINLMKNKKIVKQMTCSFCGEFPNIKYLFEIYPIIYDSNLLFKKDELVAVLSDADVVDEKRKFNEYYRIVDTTETSNVVLCMHDWRNRMMPLRKAGYRVLPFWLYFIGFAGGIDFERMCWLSDFLGMSVGEMIRAVKENCENRKILMFYGNCQINTYNSLITTSADLLEKYVVVKIKHVCEINEYTKNLTKDFFQKIDLFIYQHVSIDNKFSKELSTDVITEYLRKDAIKICIPNAYFTGYFPQSCYDPYNYYLPLKTVVFAMGDKNIREMTDRGMTAKDIAVVLKREDFYSKEEIEQNIERTLRNLREREKLCDIIISDFIIEWYCKRQLFYTQNHPSAFLLNEVLRRVFSYLGENYSFKVEGCYECTERETFIYPSVAKELGLPFAKDRYCYFCKIDEEPSNMEHYVEAYQKYCKKTE